MAALVSRGFAEERETSDAAAVRRVDGDVRYGVFITAAGAAAIGVGLSSAAGGAVGMDAAASPPCPRR